MVKAEIGDRELEEYLEALPADDMVHFTMADGRFRGALFHGTHLVNRMRAQHAAAWQTAGRGPDILECYILGQACLSAALLIPAVMKGREHVSWTYDVESAPARGFCVEADSAGWVRGHLLADRIPLEKPLDSWDMAPFLGGEGIMTVQTLRPGDKYPQTSSVNTTGNIADDLVFYFDRSEQIKTALTTSIQMDRQGRVIGAGGIFLQVMPETGGSYGGVARKGSQLNSSPDYGADGELLSRLEERCTSKPAIGSWFSEGKGTEDYLAKVFGEFSPVVALHRSVVYDCPCSKELFLRHVRSLPQAELDDIRRKGEPLELVCRNCSSVYHIGVEEL
ncbi:MAG: Hsp33 family molecular chaperone HslO [Treponema sp.]|nr:Hsp33 family molecular chaperone HslO [Treponema sp.]